MGLLGLLLWDGFKMADWGVKTNLEYLLSLKFPIATFLTLGVIGWNADKIIASIPVVDESYLWVVSPFVFVTFAVCGCIAYQQSRMNRLENKYKLLGGKIKKMRKRIRNLENKHSYLNTKPKPVSTV